MDDEFPMVPITDSSAIIAAGWQAGRMRVQWTRGDVYEYEVDQKVYELLIVSRSKGRFMQSLMASGVKI